MITHMELQRPVDIVLAVAGGGFSGEVAALLAGFPPDICVMLAYPRVEARGLQKRLKAKRFLLMRSVSWGMRRGMKASPQFWLSAIGRCIRQMRRVRPKVAIFLGSSEGLPLLVACRLLRIRCVFIESMTRVDRLSRTGEIIYHSRLAHDFLVQWAALVTAYPRAGYEGIAYDIRYGRHDIL
jgi:hypothetical protein